MATLVQFISVTDLKQTGYVDENVDDKIIRNVILSAQEMNIKEILGTALYDKLVTEITAGTTASPYTTLLGTYIRPCLVWYAMYEGVMPLSLKFRNKGVMTQSSDNSQPVGLSDLKSLMDFLLDRAEEYRKRLVKYLQQNASSSVFPEYLNPGTGVDTITPDSQSYTSTWVLNGTKRCDNLDNTCDCE